MRQSSFSGHALVRDGKLEDAMQTYHSIRSPCRSLHQFASLAFIEADFLQYAAALMNASNQGKAAKDLLSKAIQDFGTKDRNLNTATIYLSVGRKRFLTSKTSWQKPKEFSRWGCN